MALPESGAREDGIGKNTRRRGWVWAWARVGLIAPYQDCMIADRGTKAIGHSDRQAPALPGKGIGLAWCMPFICILYFLLAANCQIISVTISLL